MSEPAEEQPPSPVSSKLNILALPSYTAILFALIALVVLGAVFASLLPGSQLWWPPVVLGLTLLSLRDYLRRPALWMRRQRLAPSDAATATGQPGQDPALRQAVQRIQVELVDLAGGRQAPPLVTVSPRRLAAHAFGTARQRYVGIGEEAAIRLAKSLQHRKEGPRRPARAILAHELAHFLNRDIWMVGLSYSLLKMMILVMLVNLWVGFALSLFIIEVSPEVLQPAFWEEIAQFLGRLLPPLPPPDLSWVIPSLQQENPAVFAQLADPSQGQAIWTPFFLFLVSVHLPFIVSGVVLFGLYWRRLLRVREFYADARAASLVKNGTAVRQALALHKVQTALTSTAPAAQPRLHRWRRGLSDRLPAARPQFALHPSRELREQCLAEPQKVFGSWRSIAVSAGLAVVLLELVLRGALTAGYIYEPGAHLAFAASFVVFSLWLLPQDCMGRQRDPRLGRAVVGMVLLFTAIKLAPYLLDLAAALLVQATNPAGWGLAIDLWVYGMVGQTGDNLPRLMGVEVTWAEFIRWHILTPLAYFALLMPTALLTSLWLDSALKRRTLTWYRLGRRVRWAWLAITLVLLVFLLTVVIPVGNRLFFPWIYPNLSPLALTGIFVGIALAVLGGLGFVAADRRWAGRCACEAPLPGPFELDKTCPRCQARQHEWLIASY